LSHARGPGRVRPCALSRFVCRFALGAMFFSPSSRETGGQPPEQ
jgi:hypothetical protein